MRTLGADRRGPATRSPSALRRGRLRRLAATPRPSRSCTWSPCTCCARVGRPSRSQASARPVRRRHDGVTAPAGRRRRRPARPRRRRRVRPAAPDAPVPGGRRRRARRAARRRRPGRAARRRRRAPSHAGHRARRRRRRRASCARCSTPPACDIVDLALDGTTPEKIRIRAGGQACCGSTAAVARGRRPARRAARDALDGAARSSSPTTAAASPRQPASARRSPRRRAPVVWDPHPRGAGAGARRPLVTPNLAEAAALAPRARRPRRRRGRRPRAGARAARWRRRSRSCVTLRRARRRCSPRRRRRRRSRSPRRRRRGDPCGAGDRFAAPAAGRSPTARCRRRPCAAAVDAATAFVAPAARRARRTAAPAAAGAAATRRCRARARRRRDGRRHRRLLRPAARGPRATLEAARALGDCLVVLPELRRLGPPPQGRRTGRWSPQEDRAAVLRALRCVDAVVIFDEDTPSAVLERLRPDVWAKGGDYADRATCPRPRCSPRWGGRVGARPVPRRAAPRTRLIQEVADPCDADSRHRHRHRRVVRPRRRGGGRRRRRRRHAGRARPPATRRTARRARSSTSPTRPPTAARRSPASIERARRRRRGGDRGRHRRLRPLADIAWEDWERVGRGQPARHGRGRPRRAAVARAQRRARRDRRLHARPAGCRRRDRVLREQVRRRRLHPLARRRAGRRGRRDDAGAGRDADAVLRRRDERYKPGPDAQLVDPAESAEAVLFALTQPAGRRAARARDDAVRGAARGRDAGTRRPARARARRPADRGPGAARAAREVPGRRLLADAQGARAAREPLGYEVLDLHGVRQRAPCAARGGRAARASPSTCTAADPRATPCSPTCIRGDCSRSRATATTVRPGTRTSTRSRGGAGCWHRPGSTPIRPTSRSTLPPPGPRRAATAPRSSIPARRRGALLAGGALGARDRRRARRGAAGRGHRRRRRARPRTVDRRHLRARRRGRARGPHVRERARRDDRRRGTRGVRRHRGRAPGDRARHTVRRALRPHLARALGTARRTARSTGSCGRAGPAIRTRADPTRACSRSARTRCCRRSRSWTAPRRTIPVRFPRTLGKGIS